MNPLSLQLAQTPHGELPWPRISASIPMCRILPGSPTPLGATWTGQGVNVALVSKHGTRVWLSLFDHAESSQPFLEVELPERTGNVWHGYFPDLRPGQLYGFRVEGEYNPQEGLRFNPCKILWDPYGKAVGRPLKWHSCLFGYPLGTKKGGRAKQDLTMDGRDSSPHAPLAMVVHDDFDWKGDTQLNTPWYQTLIYETHVKSLSRLHPDVPEHLRGTYLGACSRPILDHLRELGVTAIEFLPVHYFIDDYHLVNQEKVNYWGYNPLGYFAPEPRYCASSDPLEQLREFKTMVKTFHQHGIEVILDVVYNHTAEGGQLGPTLSWRGIDNKIYYRLNPENPQGYKDYSGCGNTLDAREPAVLQLIMDSLRYWVTEMHVDGFRFDLASALARESDQVDVYGGFFDIIHQDPILSTVKLIAEPWDVGVGGYQVGRFPPQWMEWNDKYRDTVRRFWNGYDVTLGEFATRLAGSSDLYEHARRPPQASINFVTCHDGFSLWDLVRYVQKHNEANGEHNRDGSHHNLSQNLGVEGPSDDAALEAQRYQLQRNFLMTLMLSLGTPMVRGGDELSQTQQGNNNPYCQDSPISWIDWDCSEPMKERFLSFTQRLVALTRHNPVFHRRRFFDGVPCDITAGQDITWFGPDGKSLEAPQWESTDEKVMGVLYEGSAIGELGEEGQCLLGDSMLLLINGSAKDVPFVLPCHRVHGYWQAIIHTQEETGIPRDPYHHWLGGFDYLLAAHSMVLFKLVNYAVPSETHS